MKKIWLISFPDIWHDHHHRDYDDYHVDVKDNDPNDDDDDDYHVDDDPNDDEFVAWKDPCCLLRLDSKLLLHGRKHLDIINILIRILINIHINILTNIHINILTNIHISGVFFFKNMVVYWR